MKSSSLKEDDEKVFNSVLKYWSSSSGVIVDEQAMKDNASALVALKHRLFQDGFTVDHAFSEIVDEMKRLKVVQVDYTQEMDAFWDRVTIERPEFRKSPAVAEALVHAVHRGSGFGEETMQTILAFWDQEQSLGNAEVAARSMPSVQVQRDSAMARAAEKTVPVQGLDESRPREGNGRQKPPLR